MHQLAILFYFETPGTVGIEEGVTGFIPYSHRWLLEGIKRSLNKDRLDCNPSTLLSIDWEKHKRALTIMQSNLCHDIIQLKVTDEKAIIAFGPLLHSRMWCNKLMPGNQIRVTQNCKIMASSALRSDYDVLKRFIKSIPKNSLLRRLCSHPILLDKNDDNWVGEKGKELNMLADQYCQLVLGSNDV